MQTKELLKDWISDRDQDTFVSRFDDEKTRISWKDEIEEGHGYSSYIYGSMEDISIEDLARKAYSIASTRMTSMGIHKYKLRLSSRGINCTDGDQVIVSTKVLADRSLAPTKRVDVLLGEVVHECAHILYSDFDTLKEAMVHFPYKIFKTIFNIIEDEYIERTIGRDYPGYSNYISSIKEYLLQKDILKGIDKKKKTVDEIIGVFFQFIRYPKYIEEGTVEKYGDLLKSMHKIFADGYPTSTKESFKASVKVFNLLKDYYEEHKDILKDEEEDEEEEKTIIIHTDASDPKGGEEDEEDPGIDEDTTVILEGTKYEDEEETSDEGTECKELIDNREIIERPDDEDTDKEEKDESEMEDSSSDSGESSDMGDSEKEDSESTEKDGEAGTSAESDESEDSSGSDRRDKEGSSVSEESTADDESDSSDISGRDEEDLEDESDGSPSDTSGSEDEIESGAGDTETGSSREDEEGGDKESASDTDESGSDDTGSISGSEDERTGDSGDFEDGDEEERELLEEEEGDDAFGEPDTGDTEEPTESSERAGVGSDDPFSESVDPDDDYSSKPLDEEGSVARTEGDLKKEETPLEPRDFVEDSSDIADELNRELSSSVDTDSSKKTEHTSEIHHEVVLEIEGDLIGGPGSGNMIYLPMTYGDETVYHKVHTKVQGFARTLSKQLNFDTFIKNDMLRGLRNGKIDETKIVEASMGVETVYGRDIENKARGGVLVILLDESGSMCSRESNGMYRYEIAQELGVLFNEAMAKTSLDYYIYGHTADLVSVIQKNRRINLSGSGKTFILCYKEGRKSQFPKHNLSNVTSRCQNRDGDAIYAVAHRVRKLIGKRDEPIYLMVISDGQPYASDYGGQKGMQHTAKMIQTVKKELNTTTIGVGVHVTYAMKQIYGDDFVNFGDMRTFVKDVGKLIRKIIKQNYK